MAQRMKLQDVFVVRKKGAILTFYIQIFLYRVDALTQSVIFFRGKWKILFTVFALVSFLSTVNSHMHG